MKNKRVPKDTRGGHVRIYWEIVDSHAWHALSWLDVGLYIAMRRKLKGSNNGNIEATLSSVRDVGIKSSASLSKALRALQAVGLIDKTRQGGVASGGKLCSLYRFTDESVWELPKQGVKEMNATNDWNQFTSHAQARAAVRDAHHASLRASTKEKRKARELNRTDSSAEPIDGKPDSVPERASAAQLQFPNTAKWGEQPGEPA